MSNQDFNPLNARHAFLQAGALFDKYAIGMQTVGRLMLSSALQGGVCHFLAEGLPGGGKTRSAEVMARIIGGKEHIIQGTPDLMPKDITGSEFYDKAPGEGQSGEWKIRWTGLADANIILADEVNRMVPATQSALLSPMSEGRVSVQASHAAESVRYMHKVNVFMLTQNPIEQEGTNPLPEAQQDRILYKVLYPKLARADEKYLLQNPHLGDREILDEIKPVMSLDDILDTRDWVRNNMRVSEPFQDYLLSVVRATTPGEPEFVALYDKFKGIRPILNSIKSGTSTRASLALIRACQVRAFLYGVDEDGLSPRSFVMPEDLKALARPVMRHRILMTDQAAMHRNGKDTGEKRWASPFPTDGTITRAQVVERLELPGRNPITSDHVVDAILTHMDPTTDWSVYKG